MQGCDPFGDSDFRLTEVDRVPAATDPLGPNHLPELTTQRRYLEGLLTRAGWSYTLVTDAERFAAELRSGGYLAYLLLSEHVKLGEPIQKELREAVYRAEGLLEAGGHDQRQGRVDQALGIDFRGKHSRMTGLELHDSVVGPAATAELGLDHRTLRAGPGSAEPIGVFLGTPEPAVTLQPYGEGRSLYGGLDLLAEATLAYDDTSLFAGLILEGLGWVHPPILPPWPGGVYPVHITLTNLGIATPGRVRLTLPEGVTLVDADGAEPDPLDPHQWLWSFDLAERTRTGSGLLLFTVNNTIGSKGTGPFSGPFSGLSLCTHRNGVLALSHVTVRDSVWRRAKTRPCFRSSLTGLPLLEPQARDATKFIEGTGPGLPLHKQSPSSANSAE